MICKECGKYNPDKNTVCSYCGEKLADVSPEKQQPSTTNTKQIIEENEKYFSFYTKFPKILTIVLAVIFFIWRIVDPSVSGGSYYDDDYGMLIETGSFFGTMIIWWLIGAVVCAITYVVSKLTLSYKVLHIYYLKDIKESLEKKN